MFTIKLKRLLAATTALSMLAPIMPAAAQDDTSTAAPPGRVGEVAGVSGSVSFNGAGSNGQWVAATANYPLTGGDSLFTQDGAQATVAVDSSRITLSGNTEIQVTALNASTLAATASQGETFLAINYLQPGQQYVITTPRGTVTIAQNGNYDIAAGDANTPTIVTVINGAATVADPGADVQVAEGQEAVLSGTDQTTAQLGTAQRDDFINAMLAQEAPQVPSYAPAVVNRMTGVSQLGQYGSWNQDATYGAVWYPQVGSDWAPYHEGHWAYVAPWGYTWVESEPWGFAPFHYGRWIDVDDRWGWVPAYGGGGYAPDYQPVYAPAVVSFFGLGIAALTIGALASGSIGWVPLAPNEPYYPSYGYSPAYLRQINVVNVRNINVINVHNTTINNYYGNFANRRAATYVPANTLTHGENVGRFARAVPADQFAKARPIDFAPGQGGGGHGGALPPPQIAHRAAAAPHLAAFAQRRALPPAVVSHEPAPALRPGQAFAGPPGENKPNAAPRPPGMMQQNHPGMAQPAHPAFANLPGYHAPPPPPGGNQRPGAPAAGMGMNHPGQPGAPAGFAHTPAPPRPEAAQAFHPQGAAMAPHPPAPPADRPHAPAEAYHPQAPVQQFHPQPAQHAPMPQVYHPQAPAEEARPQAPAQQFHPQEQARPQMPPPAYHPQVQQQIHEQMQQFHPQPEPRPAPPPERPQPEQKKPGQP